jgi:hypothetical protein
MFGEKEVLYNPRPAAKRARLVFETFLSKLFLVPDTSCPWKAPSSLTSPF